MEKQGGKLGNSSRQGERKTARRVRGRSAEKIISKCIFHIVEISRILVEMRKGPGKVPLSVEPISCEAAGREESQDHLRIVEFDGERYCHFPLRGLPEFYRGFLYFSTLLACLFQRRGLYKRRDCTVSRYRFKKRRRRWETGFITSFCSICAHTVPSYVKLCL